MFLEEFCSRAGKRIPSAEQQSNLEKVIEISRRFGEAAGIEGPDKEAGPGSFVVESGHQPNYLPHAGTWKKAFLGSRIAKRIEGAVFLFGFADQNVSTAKILSTSRLPAATRTGALPIGFKIPEKDRWKTFDSLPKPAPEAFEKELEKISAHYGGNIHGIEEEMRESYARAKNLADYNSFLFARMLALKFGVSAYFFRYSDAQKEKLFSPEWSRILSDLPRYNAFYNRVIGAEGIEDMHPVEPDVVPFWLHCPCGTKARMRLVQGKLSGNCPACKTMHGFPLERLPEYLPQMSPAAVSRNMVYAEGLGTSIYVSGAGGGLRYGKVSDALSRELGFNPPATIAWTGRDYYLGPVHETFLRDLARNAGTGAFADKEALDAALRKRRADLAEGIGSSRDRKDAQKYEGQKKTLEQMLASAKEMFSQTHSFLDEYVSIGPENIIASWDEAIASAEVRKAGDAGIMRTDQAYSRDAKQTIMNLSGVL